MRVWPMRLAIVLFAAWALLVATESSGIAWLLFAAAVLSSVVSLMSPGRPDIARPGGARAIERNQRLHRTLRGWRTARR